MGFELIVITSPTTIPDEAKLIIDLFKVGLKKLHVRKPGFSKKELEEFISRIPKKYRRRLVLHSHYSLASQFSVGGIHLTERTKTKSLPPAYNKRKHSLSASFHSLNDIVRARRNYDYILLSPIFDSISKAKYKSAFRLEELEVFLHKHSNVIALGGIDHKTLRLAQLAGFKGAALLGYIWQSRNPVKAFEKLRSKIK
jgi:thiamine-phosphate pyrophosphorylase